MSFSLSTVLWGPIISDAISAALVLLLGWLAVRRAAVVPGRLQNLMEIALETFEGLVSQMARPGLVRGLTFLGVATFLYLLVANLLGLLPTMELGIHSPTADINTPAGMAAAVFILVQLVGIKYKGLWGYIKGWVWKPIPIFGFLVNLLEQGIMPLSLSFRLFGNILAGERVLEMLNGAAVSPVGWALVVILGTIWLAFSNFVSLIQALIFTILMLAYISIMTSEDH